MAAFRCIGRRFSAVSLLISILHWVSEARPYKKLHGGKLFKKADSPYAGDAPTPLFGDKCAEVAVIPHAERTQYYQVESERYDPPSCKDWSQAVLRLRGAVQGTQFDRFGAVWLSGVELLRTTTPEPTEKGIAWEVIRDITHTAPILRKPGNLSIMIPNVVNAQYTGKLKVSLSLLFYRPRTPLFSPIQSKIVHPLFEFKDKNSPSIFEMVQLDQPTHIKTDASGLPRNMNKAFLEVFASAHGCEEFWYSNLPDDKIQLEAFDGCGGGAYREIEVHIDDMLAGLAYPFPVIYTGGLNPLLWRPQTGIGSFNVPPYNFDLSPFLGVLNDGRKHTISVSVRNQNVKGYWFLNPILHAELDPEVSEFTGKVLHHSDDKPSVDFVAGKHAKLQSASVFTTKGGRELKVTGTLENAANGITQIFVTRHSLQAHNQNVDHPTTQITNGWMHSHSSTHKFFRGDSRPVESTLLRQRFPYFFFDHDSSGFGTMEQGPTKVNYSRHVDYKVARAGEPLYELKMASSIHAGADFNQSFLGGEFGDQVNHQRGTSREESSLFAGSSKGSCFNSHLTASLNGKQSSRKIAEEACSWQSAPYGLYACGLSFCTQLDKMGRNPAGFLQATPPSFAVEVKRHLPTSDLDSAASKRIADILKRNLSQSSLDSGLDHEDLDTKST